MFINRCGGKVKSSFITFVNYSPITTKMKKAFLFLFMVFCAISINAQDLDFMENAPDGYLPSNTKIITSRTSPCNQGEEAFMDFIPKFRTDKAFRNTRIRIDENDEIAKSSVEWFDNWQIIKAGKGRTATEKYWGTWYNVSKDAVCFAYTNEPTDPNAEWGGSGAYFSFRRIDGKWYLTGIALAG